MLQLNYYLKENNEAYYKTNDVQLKLQELKPFIEGNTEAEKLYNNIYLDLNSLQILLSKDGLNENASDRYQVREFTDEDKLDKRLAGAKYGVYDTKEKKFIQKGSKNVMIAACDDLNKKSLNESEYILYHRSKEDFNYFDDKYIGNNFKHPTYGDGFYFYSDDYDWAFNRYGGIVYKVKVNLQKPFIIQESKFNSTLDKMGFDRVYGNKSEFLQSKGYDGAVIMNKDKILEVIVYSNRDNKIEILDKEENNETNKYNSKIE